jgi:hypothetical protein
MRSVAASVAVSALILSYAIGGPKALAGMSMGLFGTLFNLLALWWVISWSSRSEGVPKPSTGATLIVLAFFVKLPVLVALGLYAQKLGDAAPTSFLLGLGLVYAGLIWFAIRDSNAKIRQEVERSQRP